MKKNRIEWKSFVLGLVACLTLIIMLSTIKPLISAPQSDAKAPTVQRALPLSTQMQNIEIRLTNIETKLQLIQDKEELLYKDLHLMWAGLEREIRND
ncbi:MAG: hypothetical protein PHX05_10315 [Acidobacteriota bacterium]|jgi:hypothetical protein|nr:hypothetical protein [Acidobacteriota bacterium]